LVVAGLLVGVGTSYGSGCTSGHGVCGMSRLSPRSIAATAIFMGAGFVTVFLIRHVVAA
ncbi:MAG TPA: YeeE/YedE family protein, partial [Ramlibacter sp.]|nr:YeeE/YedE family protein [Ramlibacter sp.]